VYYYPPVVAVGGGGTSSGSGGSAQQEIKQLREQVEKLQGELKKLKEKTGTEGPTASVGTQPAPARVTVRLPADAALCVDDVPCPLTSGTRSFNTPALQPGQKYFYTVRAEVTRNGEKRSQAQRVILEAGQQVTVTFTDFAPALATAGR